FLSHCHLHSFPTRRSSDLQALCLSKDIMRALIYSKNSRMPRIVHVRDTLMSEPDAPALQFSRPALNVASSTTIQHTLDHMRARRSEEHTSELQSRFDLVCR